MKTSKQNQVADVGRSDENLRQRATKSVEHASCSCAYDHLERFARSELLKAVEITATFVSNDSRLIAAAIRRMAK